MIIKCRGLNTTEYQYFDLETISTRDLKILRHTQRTHLFEVSRKQKAIQRDSPGGLVIGNDRYRRLAEVKRILQQNMSALDLAVLKRKTRETTSASLGSSNLDFDLTEHPAHIKEQ